MQIQFVEEDYDKYANANYNYNFPDPPNKCPICNKYITMKKHGFYRRYFITRGFSKKILVRRYICQECGRTISYLPYFCTPFFQYYIGLIIKYIGDVIRYAGTLKSCIEELRKENPDIMIERQHIYFYIKRFIANTVFIQHGIRQLKPYITYDVNESDKRKRVMELIEIISSGFKSTHVFGKRFRDNCNRAFLGSLN